MSEIRIATRYAKSLIELAQEKGVLEEVHNDMQVFEKVVDENRNLALALRNPIIKSDKKRAILKALFKDASPLTTTFFEVVTKKNRSAVLPLVAEEFHRQYTVINKIQEAQIETAIPLDEKMRKEFLNIIKEVSGKDKVELTEHVDPELIGGFVLTVGDKQIDDSIKSKLRLLKRDLTKNQYIKEF